MPVQSPELLNEIAQLRMKMAAGTFALEDVQRAMTLLRENRKNAATSKATKTKRTKAPPRSADELLGDI